MTQLEYKLVKEFYMDSLANYPHHKKTHDILYNYYINYLEEEEAKRPSDKSIHTYKDVAKIMIEKYDLKLKKIREILK